MGAAPRDSGVLTANHCLSPVVGGMWLDEDLAGKRALLISGLGHRRQLAERRLHTRVDSQTA